MDTSWTIEVFPLSPHIKNHTKKEAKKTSFQYQILEAGGFGGKERFGKSEWCIFYQGIALFFNLIGKKMSQSKFIIYKQR